MIKEQTLDRFIDSHGQPIELLSRMERNFRTTGWWVFEDGASYQRHPNGPVMYEPASNRDQRLKVQGEYHSEHVKRAEEDIDRLTKEISDMESWSAKYKTPKPSKAMYEDLAELQHTLSHHQAKLGQVQAERANESDD